MQLDAKMNINWLELLFGGFIGFFSAYLFELLKRPNITIYPNPNKQFGINNKWLFLNAIVENKKQTFPFRSMNASQVSAWIYFLDFDSSAEIKQVRARWSSSRQPILEDGKVDYANLLVTPRESIPINEKSEIAVILKVFDKDDHNIYAFNNESYEFNNQRDLWRKESYSIGKLPRYKVRIKVLADGYEFCETLTLLNSKEDGSIDAVSLQKR